MTALFANNATTRLPDDLAAGSTSLLVWPGDGAKFPNPTAGDFFAVTLEDRRTGQIEICKCTSRSGDMLQIVRAQEGTTAQNFAMGATVSNRMTAAVLSMFFTYGWSRQESDDRYVNVSGDTMVGELSVPLLPSAPAHATSKDYVDYQISLIGGIAEPPDDSNVYARHYQGWTVSISKATFDSNITRLDNKNAAQDLTIGQNTADIATNKANIATNTANIVTNTTNIATNQSEIAALQSVNGAQDVSISQLQTNKVNKAGDVMTGPLTVVTPPTADAYAASKKYVDDQLGSVNQFPEAPLDGRQYARYMAGWQKVAVVGTTSTGDIPPTALLEPGQMWFESDTGSLFIWYDDGNSQQWVQINTAARSVGGDVPVGTVVDYAGDVAPSGWMLCFGQAMSRILYPALYGKIGTFYGPGDGVNTFNLPDCRDRTAVGKGDMGGAAANRITVALSGFDSKVLGGAGGSEGIILDLTTLPAHAHTGSTDDNNVDHTHTYSGNSGYISADHSHSLNINSGAENSDHNHTIFGGTSTSGAGVVNVGVGSNTYNVNTNWRNQAHGHNVAGGTSGVSANHYHAFSGTTAAQSTKHKHVIPLEGGGAAHRNVQPTIVFNKIIKV